MLTKQQIIDKASALVDTEAWDALHAEYTEVFLAQGDTWSPLPIERMERNYSKYFDLELWFSYHSRHVITAGLNGTDGPKHILDLGCGAGIFLHICQALGHTGVGLDIDSNMYRRMAQILDVDWRVAPIIAKSTLDPSLTGYDMITAIAIKFDRLDWGPQGSEPWDLDAWQFFLSDAASRLKDGGTLFIKPNYFVHPTESQPGIFFKDSRILDYLTEISTTATESFEFIIPKSALV